MRSVFTIGLSMFCACQLYSSPAQPACNESVPAEIWGDRVQIHLDISALSEEEKINIVAALYASTPTGLEKAAKYLEFYRDNISKFSSIAPSDDLPQLQDKAVISQLLLMRLVSELVNERFPNGRSATRSIDSILDRPITEFDFKGGIMAGFADELAQALGNGISIYVSEYGSRYSMGPIQIKNRSAREILTFISEGFHFEFITLPDGNIVLTRFLIPFKYGKVIERESDHAADALFQLFR